MQTTHQTPQKNRGACIVTLLLLFLLSLSPLGRGREVYACVQSMTEGAEGTTVRLICEGTPYTLTTKDEAVIARFAGHRDGVYDVVASMHGWGMGTYLSFKDILICAMRSR